MYWHSYRYVEICGCQFRWFSPSWRIINCCYSFVLHVGCVSSCVLVWLRLRNVFFCQRWKRHVSGLCFYIFGVRSLWPFFNRMHKVIQPSALLWSCIVDGGDWVALWKALLYLTESHNGTLLLSQASTWVWITTTTYTHRWYTHF